MSNVIPIVSSSPPPLEDTGGFDDWGDDDDDFGGFMGADVAQNSWNNSQSNQISDEINANFPKQIPQNTERIENYSPLTLNLDKSLPYNSNISNENLDNKSVIHENKTLTESGNSTGDSGLFDASPIPISEDTKSDHSDISPDNDTFRETPDSIPDQLTCTTDTNSEHKNQNFFNNDQLELNVNNKTCECDTESESGKNCNVNSCPDSDEIVSDCQNINTDKFIVTDDDVLSNSCSSLTNDNSTSSNETNSSPERKVAIESSASHKIEGSKNESSCQSIDSINNAQNKKLEHSSGNIPHDNEQLSHSDNLDESLDKNNDISSMTNGEHSKIDEDKACLSEGVVSDNDECANLEESTNEKENSTFESGSLSLNQEEESENKVDDLQFNSDLSKPEDIVKDQTENDNEYDKENVEQSTNLHSIQTENDGNELVDPSSDNENAFADFSSDKIQGNVDKLADFESHKTGDNEAESADFSSVRTTKNEDEFADFSSVRTKENEDEFADFSSVRTTENEEKSADFSLVRTTENEDEFADFSSTKTVENENAFANFSSAKSTESENNFADFNSAAKNEDDDEFADFGSATCTNEDEEDGFANFNTKNSTENTDEFTDLSSTNINENDDGFADFSCAQQKEKTSENDSSFAEFSSEKNCQEQEEFACFTKSNKEDNDFGDFESDDDFADFSSAPNDNKESDFNSVKSQSNVEGGPSLSNEKDSWSTFHQTNTTIPSSKPTQSVSKPDEVCNTLTECYKESVIVSEQTNDLDIVIQEKNVLWVKLQKTDNTAMVKWPNFTSNKNLFVSLKIDTKNILLGYKKPTVPIYAANLTLLEPTKGLPILQPEVTLVDTNKQEEVKDLPPVQFDWTSSGLTNPLEVNSKLQQLDFLTVDESELPERSKAFDSAVGHGQKASMQPLQNILANLKVTKKTKLEDLSNEAGRVISHLPDLSFMKAKVLMFPLKQNDL